MKPGRELDALVAEKVMGCTLEAHHQEKYGPTCGCPQRNHRNTREDLNDLLADYSTDIQYAWDVVEKLMDWRVKMTFDGGEYTGDCWDVHICHAIDFDTGRGIDPPHIGEGEAPTLPHAICLAALDTVGHPVPLETPT